MKKKLDRNRGYYIVAHEIDYMENMKMSYIIGVPRLQCDISSLDEWISADNPVRLIDLLVDMLYAEGLGESIKTGKKHTGRPAYHPCDMLKLYLYGYMNKIPSSRRLEAETKRNIELKWLLHNLSPDFKTIADFRKDNKDTIQDMVKRFTRMLKDNGLITGKLMAIDGTKIKANAGANKITCEKIEADLAEINAEIEKYFAQLQRNDSRDEVAELVVNDMEVLEQIDAKIRELEQEKEKLQELQKQGDLIKSGNVNPTDPESRLMRGHKETFFGYNVQAIVDAENKLIASAQVTQALNDRAELVPAVKNLSETVGIVAEVILADGGYDSVAAIQEVESHWDTEVLVMIKDEKESGDSFSKWSFTFNEEENCYYCPMGHKLKPRGGIQKNKKRLHITYQCNKKICDSCPSRAKCTKSKDGRSINRYIDEEWTEAYRRKVLSLAIKELLRRRKAIIEHVFGILKCWMGKIPLLLRGREKVQTEINLYTTAYNLKRLIKICGFDGVKNMVMGIQTG